LRIVPSFVQVSCETGLRLQSSKPLKRCPLSARAYMAAAGISRICRSSALLFVSIDVSSPTVNRSNQPLIVPKSGRHYNSTFESPSGALSWRGKATRERVGRWTCWSEAWRELRLKKGDGANRPQKKETRKFLGSFRLFKDIYRTIPDKL